MTKIQNTAGWKIILFLLAFVAIFVAAAIISDLLTGWINHPAVKVLVRELLIKIPLTLAGFYLFASRVIGVKGEDVYLTGFNRRIFLWLIGGIVITGVAFILIIFMARPGVFERIGNLPARSISYYIAATFALALSAAILEETLFRGYILGILEKKWNAAIAIVTPSVLFGLLHLAGLS
ncbi:MAG TPA: type II CAAX endopeptidase family protein, partial [Bacteroidales bacterium]|nr:type II CAAX endopeptidase family protein [Bacteroidales bacterium]